MGRQRKTIGVLIAVLDSFYKSELWSGLRDKASELDYNVLFFCGRPLLSPIGQELQDNAIYTLINPEKIDGIVTEAGTISSYMDLDNFEIFLKRYKALPVVNVSVDMKDHHSIVIDNRAGMKKLVLHMIETHGYTKIAFVTGPITNLEAEERLMGYKDALAAYEIPVKDEFIYHGNFNQVSGNNSIIEFYEIRKIAPEVIVFSNDEMAIGGILQLEILGKLVPNDVKVSGFDDIENAKSFSVALTTIRQPFYKMGNMAMTKADDVINGKSVNRIDAVEGDFIVRESCGCYKVLPNYNDAQKMLFELLYSEVPYDFDAFEKVIIEHISEISKILTKLINGQLVEDYCTTAFEKILQGLVVDFHTRHTDGAFLRKFYKLLKQSIMMTDIELDWQGFIYGFIVTMNELPMNDELNQFMQEITQLTSVVVTNLSNRKEVYREFDFKNLYYRTSYLIQEMNTVQTRQEMNLIIQDVVREYQFDRFYMCLFDDFIESEIGHNLIYPEEVTLEFGYKSGQIIDPIRFETSEMLPDHILYQEERADLVFFPLYFKTMQFGYLAADLKSVKLIVFKTLRELICNALAQLVLFKEIESYTKQLEEASVMDPLTHIYNRRGFYRYGNALYEGNSEDPIIVIFGDIDKLKEINDLYGHEAGDKVIATTGHIFRELFAESDILGRIGGDEFIIMISKESDDKHPEDYIQLIQEKMAIYNEQSNEPYQLGMSFGYAIYDRADNRTFDDLIKEADQMLYKSKKNRKE